MERQLATTGMSHKSLKETRSALDLVEEAIHLLRRLPFERLALYYIGSVPFVLGLLFFWSDMSRSAFAERHVMAAALGVTALFVWMKCWQAVFARGVLTTLDGNSVPRWNIRSLARLGLTQVVLQPAGLFLIPPALVLLLPFAWVYAFFQNVTVLGGADETVSQVCRRAWRQARLWPIQNNNMLLVIKLFAIFVYLNWTMSLVAMPWLLKTLLGIETAASQSIWSLLNSTFLAAVAGLTYLCVDPLLKTIYVLRCFYGESLQTGQDLRAALQWMSNPLENGHQDAAGATAGAIPQAGQPAGRAGRGALRSWVLLILTCLSLTASGAPPPPAEASLEPAQFRTESVAGNLPVPILDASIEDVIGKPQYAWRMPRERVEGPDRGGNALTRWLKRIMDSIQHAWKAVGRSLGRIIKWLENKLRPIGVGKGGAPFGFSGLQVLVFGIAAILAALLALMVWRWWQRRSRLSAKEVLAQTLVPTPDLSHPDTTADQLPQEGWLELAHELLQRAEWRLSLRAFYLASLAGLAGQNLLSIARHKSNRDYERELQRRAHALPDLCLRFGENVSIFDRVWYGLHDVDEALVRHFAARVEQMLAPSRT